MSGSRKPTTLVNEQGRICTQCHKYKLWSFYNVFMSGTNGHDSMCIDCRNKRRKRPNQHKEQRYGLQPFEFEQRLKDQFNKCDICELELINGDNGKKPNSAHMDHCSKTGKVRKILCRNCNWMLGFSKENPSTLRRAADYLEKHNASN